MLTLALDTVTPTIGVAIVNGEELLAEVYLNLGRHHAELLLPALQQTCRLAGVEINGIDLLVCTTGPGSFTGVRIGVSTLKGLGLAGGKPLVGVSALEALALNVMPTTATVCTLLDARKEQVYAGLFRMGGDGFPESVLPESLSVLEPFLATLAGDVLFVGDGAIRYGEQISRTLAARAKFAGPLQRAIRGAAVAWIGQRRFLQGTSDDLFTLSPRYLRISEAEAKRSAGLLSSGEAMRAPVASLKNVTEGRKDSGCRERLTEPSIKRII